jgi:hypothetical protein
MSNWHLLGASVKGHYHQQANLPCQDYGVFKNISPTKGIVVVADGAGSAAHSDWGAKFVCEESMKFFSQIIDNQQLIDKCFTQPLEWQSIVHQKLSIIRTSLESYASKKKVLISDLACTLMMLIFTEKGFLVSHIGDGRGAFLDNQGHWQAMFHPYRGEYVNETVFFTSDIWQEPSKYIDCQVITTKPQAFALLTDGMEKHSFICSAYDETSQQFYDPNQAFEGFFKPVHQHLIQMIRDKIKPRTMQAKWEKFLQSGNEKIALEPDDKTMVLGVWH